MLEAIEKRFGAEPATSAVIWLHGLGASGHDFADVLPELGLSRQLSVHFVFPHAPSMPVTINGGAVMPAWYDIPSFDFEQEQDKAGLDRSAEAVLGWIKHLETQGIPSERIVLAGFSQGGAVALHAGCRAAYRLAGIMALSTYLPLHHEYPQAFSHDAREVPIWMGHGKEDPVVPCGLGQGSAKLLSSYGLSVQWNTYRMPHSVCLEELKDIGRWLNTVLS